jgi:protein TonB
MALEIKKYPRADLNNKRPLIFSVSLLITLALILVAFEWKQYDRSIVELSTRQENTFEAMIEVPPTQIPPPPAEIIVQQPQLVAVPDEEEIKEEIKFVFDVDITEETKIQEYTLVEIPKIEEESEEIFIVVEENAEPKGGYAAFYKFVSDNIKYPAPARRMNIEGKVFVEFVVGKDGKISDVKAVKGIGGGCDEEAVRIVTMAPPWNPGKQRGKPVRQRMVLPITFKLASV